MDRFVNFKENFYKSKLTIIKCFLSSKNKPQWLRRIFFSYSFQLINSTLRKSPIKYSREKSLCQTLEKYNVLQREKPQDFTMSCYSKLCPLRTCFHLERPMTRAEENSDRAAQQVKSARGEGKCYSDLGLLNFFPNCICISDSGYWGLFTLSSNNTKEINMNSVQSGHYCGSTKC